MPTEERAPVLDEEAEPALPRVPREEPLGVRGVLSSAADEGPAESIVWSTSICKSNDEPHFEQDETSSLFSVRQWGQIMDWACSFL